MVDGIKINSYTNTLNEKTKRKKYGQVSKQVGKWVGRQVSERVVWRSGLPKKTIQEKTSKGQEAKMVECGTILVNARSGAR